MSGLHYIGNVIWAISNITLAKFNVIMKWVISKVTSEIFDVSLAISNVTMLLMS